MLNENKINQAKDLIQGIGKCEKEKEVKRIGKDKSIIERLNNEKVILAEDNRQLLFS